MEKTGWGPRRFTYGGREFVWETENKNEWQPQALYEAERTRLKPGRKTGKMEHKAVGRKLVWGEHWRGGSGLSGVSAGQSIDEDSDHYAWT